MQIIPYNDILNKLLNNKKKILLYTSISGFLFTMIYKIVYTQNRKYIFNDNFKKKLLNSKLFFKGPFKKVRLELSSTEGIKYTKSQMFLSNIVKSSNNQGSNSSISNKDKTFNNLLNIYINSH